MYKVKELTKDIIPLVDSYLRSDIFLNAYAIWDLHYLRHRAKFFVCMDNSRLAGLLLDYRSHIDVHFIWLWGEEKAIEKLLNVKLPSKIVFHVSPELEDIIKQKFPITAKYPLDFMLLRKGEEKLYLKYKVKQLKLKDAYSLASLKKENPSIEEVKQAESLLKEQDFYGIFINSKLVSAACVQVKLPEIWILGGFYTKPEYRNRGYATTLASYLVKKAFEETNHVGLHVRSDNYPAKRVYQKVGFKVYKKMYWLEHNVNIIP